MTQDDLVSMITEAALPFEIVDISLYDHLRQQQPTFVNPRTFKSGSKLLISDSFSRCQGVALYDRQNSKGALAHNFPTQNPYYFLTGKWASTEDQIEDPLRIFPDPKRVQAFHVFHQARYTWPESWIAGALETIGITNVQHIPIKSREPGKVFWRHCALDVAEKSFYVFPTDFEYGLRLPLGQS